MKNLSGFGSCQKNQRGFYVQSVEAHEPGKTVFAKQGMVAFRGTSVVYVALDSASLPRTANPSSDTVVWATWNAGGIFSFVHMYGQGRISEYFQANWVTLVHDVVVTKMTSNHTWVYQGFSANINLTVLNNGDFNEMANVTLYYNIT
jgi:hypothetical protein